MQEPAQQPESSISRRTVIAGTLAGLGIELDENALADKIGHDWRNREEYDTDDGSVVDW